MTLQGRLLAGSALLVVGLSTSFVVLFTAREVRSVEAALDARGRDLAEHLGRLGRLERLGRQGQLERLGRLGQPEQRPRSHVDSF